MPVRTIKLVAIAFLVACTLPLLLFRNNRTASDSERPFSTGLGRVETLEANYRTWETGYLRNGGDRNMVMSMGWSKGLSTEHTDAYGKAQLNLIDGTALVEIKGLSTEEDWDVWLIDNSSGQGRTVLPEPGDTMLDLGTLKHQRSGAKLEVNLGETLANNEWELVVVSRKGRNPSEDRVMVGLATFFHRLYRSKERGQFGVLSDHEPVPSDSEKHGLWTRLLEFLSPTAEAQIGPNPDASGPLEQMIERGRNSFFKETFSGNGRTCGTCHREDNNLTIDPQFIATLPANDPLFVAEFTPELAALENPSLMRSFGLILENVDGFNNPGVMRGVPHTLALLQNTLTPFVFDFTATPPNERTGWSGDGAPGNGTLRDFLVGAVTQHYPKTLARRPNVDFRLPRPHELDDLEAFQRSLGRQEDLVLPLSLKTGAALRGQRIFNNSGGAFFTEPDPDPTVPAGKCFLCHLNAGASVDTKENGNFSTNVEKLPLHPGPPDGGFGGAIGVSPTGGFGDGTFNTPVLVEAADTGPFFHNNAIDTIEGAVAFYKGSEFSGSPAAAPPAPDGLGSIELDSADVDDVAAFLRVINALENIRSSIDLGQRAESAGFAQAKELLNLSQSELDDAIAVLSGGALTSDLETVDPARKKLITARNLVNLALGTAAKPARNALINQALPLQSGARADLIDP